jgi:hypothetical protein
MISQTAITSAIYQALLTGSTNGTLTGGGGIHVGAAPDTTKLPCVLILSVEKDAQDPFFGDDGIVVDYAPWRGKIMIFSDRTAGEKKGQQIFDAVIADLENAVLAGKKTSIEETEGPTQVEQYMVATVNIQLIV